ncbi:G protein coupled receptor fragment [Echinococcus multilocularis]|uniref:G protein coupled receptor n=1 Tax=Echinococcus multilocularis TaxID=6211 RepID=A0A087W1R1_ECHMU|nr:G protein coupled receptor fragment [Echinococcus multilocularis]
MATDRMNRLTTRMLMVIIAAADTSVLLTAVTRYWALEVLKTDFRNYSDLMCKMHVFAVAFFTDFAVGSLCAVAVERFLVVAFPQRANSVTSAKAVIIGMVAFAIALSIKNGIHFFIMGLREITTEGNVTVSVCTPDEDYTRWTRVFMKIDFFSFAVLPYVILFSCNLYIYCVLKKQRKLLSTAVNQRRVQVSVPAVQANSAPPNFPTAADRAERDNRTTDLPMNYRTISQKKSFSISGGGGEPKSERRKRKPEDVIKILTALTVVHVVCTLPGTIFTLLSEYTDLRRQKPTKYVLVMLIFTNNAINFFAYLASSERFRIQFVNLLSCGRANCRRRW